MHPARSPPRRSARSRFLIVFGSLVAFTAYGWLLRNASTPLLSTYAYVNPAVAVFLGWAFVGEHVGGREIAAGLVILSSVAMLMLAREAREAAPAIPESQPALHPLAGCAGGGVPPSPAPRRAASHRRVSRQSGGQTRGQAP